MNFTEITEKDGVILDIKYGTEDNFTHQKIYKHPVCYLHNDAAICLKKAVELAAKEGYKIRVFDAFRPKEAQEKLWSIFPNPDYVADPKIGSRHTRGIAVDITLTDKNGNDLDMGTPFDDFTDKSHHGSKDISEKAQKNRDILVRIMLEAGFELLRTEWWHYQLADMEKYPLTSCAELGIDMV